MKKNIFSLLALIGLIVMQPCTQAMQEKNETPTNYNYAKIIPHLQKLANQQKNKAACVEAQTLLGKMYCCAQGTPPNYPAALPLLEAAANQRECPLEASTANLLLGQMHYFGRGTPSNHHRGRTLFEAVIANQQTNQESSADAQRYVHIIDTVTTFANAVFQQHQEPAGKQKANPKNRKRKLQ